MIGQGYPARADQSALKLPQDWEVIDDIAIMDPDGWDRKNYAESWSTPITYEEWMNRAMRSTIAMGLRRVKPVVPEMGVCWNRQCKARHAMTPKCKPFPGEPESTPVTVATIVADIEAKHPGISKCIEPSCVLEAHSLLETGHQRAQWDIDARNSPETHCFHPSCKDTNWGGRDRVHQRSSTCPPPE